MSTLIRVPYGRPQVTSVWPDPEFDDSRASESDVQIKRTMTGRSIVYKKTSDRQTLRLRFLVSRMKDLEIQQLLNAFHATEWQIDLYDGSVWQAKLVGEPVRRTAVGKRDANNTGTGNEDYELFMTFSAKKIS